MDAVATTRFELRAPRRVATAPVTVPNVDRFSSSNSDGTVETLYYHSDARIVTFSAGSDGNDSSSGDKDANVPLPWSSPLERTIGVGPFRIYRAPGSVAFLNCGSALKPIMPKGQCWSITDTNSKFVLQIRRPNYWRIELPDSTQQDRDKAEALRTVLDAVLQFERTPCPFERPFTVSLPELPAEPARKKAWVPSQRSLSVDYSRAVDVAPSPAKVIDTQRRSSLRSNTRPRRDTPDPLDKGTGTEHATRWTTLDKPDTTIFEGRTVQPGRCTSNVTSAISQVGTEAGVAAPERNESSTTGSIDVASRSSSPSPAQPSPMQPIPSHSSSPWDPAEATGSRACDVSGAATDFKSAVEEEQLWATEDQTQHDAIEGSGTRIGTMKARLRRRHTGFGNLRSAPSAPKLTLIASPPSKGMQRAVTEQGESNPEEADRKSSTSSMESFHSTQSWHSPITPLPPSPPSSQVDEYPSTFPYPHDHIALPADLDGGFGAPNTPATPGTPHRSPTTSNRSTSQDRTPTQPRLRPHFSGNGAAVHSSVGSKLSETISGMIDRRTTEGVCSTAHDRTAIRRRALSPLPPAANIFIPSNNRVAPGPSATRLRTMPMMLITKTCDLLLRPPSFLVSLMLRVAARITAGEWRGTAIGYDPTGDHIPVDWDYSDSEWGDEWDSANDAAQSGLAKGKISSGKPNLKDDAFEDANQSWEVD